MTIKGLTIKEESIVKLILKRYSGEYDFYYYGSRVKGDFTPLSDLDILIKGENVFPIKDICTIQTAFDNSDLPFIVSTIDYHNLYEDFYKEIEPDLVKITYD